MLIKIPSKFISTRSFPLVFDERKNFLRFFLNLLSKGFSFHIFYILLTLACIIYRLAQITPKNLVQSLWFILLVSINIYGLISPIWFILFPPPNHNRQDLLLYQEQGENQESKVKLKPDISLYPTSKRTLLLLIFPFLLIVMAAVNIVLVYASTDFIQLFLISKNIPAS